jgi:hypothetical protein
MSPYNVMYWFVCLLVKSADKIALFIESSCQVIMNNESKRRCSKAEGDAVRLKEMQ